MLDRNGNRVLIQFLGSTSNSGCLYAPDYTLIFSGAMPARGATLYDAEATGRSTLTPLLPGSILGWNPLVNDGSQSMAVNMDAPAATQKHFLEQAIIEKAPDQTILKVATLNRDKIAYEWSYSDYVTVGEFKVPGQIKRTKFKSAGLNIPEDETTVWTLIESSETPSQGLQDSDLLEAGALVQDVRMVGKSKSFSYQREQELLTQAAGARTETISDSASNSGRTRGIVLLLVGATVGVVASFRRRASLLGEKHETQA